MLDDRLALSVASNSGRVIRWGGDERDAEMIPGDLQFSTSVPGGDKDLTCSLFRRLGSDERMFNRVRCYGPGNRTAWSGRLAQLPREDATITPGAVGMSAHLSDDASFREIYVDPDMSHWQDASVQRKLNNAGTYTFSNPSVNADTTTGQPALATFLTGPWTSTSLPISEAWYASNGIPIGSLYFAEKKNANIIPDANWTWSARLCTDDLMSSYDTSGELRSTPPVTGTVTATTSTRMWPMVQLAYITGTGTANMEYVLYWTCLAVYGTHGLTKHGTPNATQASGFYGDDLIADIVSRTAPLLTVKRGVGGIEANTSFIVPEAVFMEPTKGSDAIMDVNKYFLWEWGVYDDVFFWRPPDATRLTYQARLDQGAHVSFEGEAADAIYNGVVVRYRDAIGNTRMAGPPAVYWQGGIARANYTNAALVDTSSTNPVNAAGIPRKWPVIDLSFATTDEGAAAIGTAWLKEHSLPQRRGTITVAGSVIHPTEGPVPVWRVRAGDGVVVTDLVDDEPRRIIETRYSRATDSNVLTVGSPDYKLDAILERLGVQVGGLIGS